MLSVAAMLSSERVFQAGYGPDGGRPQGQQSQAQIESAAKLRVLMSEGLGDHVLMLRLYQLWQRAGHHRDFCREYGLDPRGLKQAKELRKQLEGAGAGGVGPLGGRHNSQKRACLCVAC